MSTTVVIGGQWGDEGKGKIVDYLAGSADMVVRYQGGCNAGHTVKIEDKVYKLNLIPSGVLTPGVTSVIGNGVVIDPIKLNQEMQDLSEQGINFDKLFISKNAHVTMPYHKLIEAAEEERKGSNKIGTTGRGIGPTYSDKISRTGLTMQDICSSDRLYLKLKQILPLKEEILRNVYGMEMRLNIDDVFSEYLSLGKKFENILVNVSSLVNDAIDESKNIIFEGAQGTLLDVDHGDYPYVTSSNTVSGGACTGAGIGPTKINNVLGVFKAYATRVGNGPFPTELFDDMGSLIRTVGAEFGTTTGRQRRCGWFDGVLAKKAVQINGISEISITKIDVLCGFDEVNFCYKYDDSGNPIYKKFKGWNQVFDNEKVLNKNVLEYVNFISEFLKVKIHSVSYGPERNNIFVF